jgi:hypothetical protein
MFRMMYFYFFYSLFLGQFPLRTTVSGVLSLLFLLLFLGIEVSPGSSK